MAKKKRQKEPERVRPEGFRKYYATNINCGYTNYDFRIEMMNEKLKTGKDWMYLVEALMILTPTAAKKLSKQLSESIKAYEKDHGKIKDEESKPNFDSCF